MQTGIDLLNRIRSSAAIKVLFLPHALHQMFRPDRMIRREEVRRVIETGELIEDYPHDARGHSCLLLGFGNDGRPLHIVCAPRDEYLAIITAYLPDGREWSDDFRTRVKK